MTYQAGGRGFYLDRNIKGLIPHSQMKQVHTESDSDGLQPGDIVEAWDHVFRWDTDCIPNSTMAKWRFRADPLADNALPVLNGPAGDAGGTDLFARLEAAATMMKTESKAATPPLEVAALWRQIHAIDRSRCAYDRAQVRRGQAVFYRYAPQILASLLQYSLSAGFSSLRVSRVLNLGSYLVPPMSSTPEGDAPRISKASNDRTYMRLMETTQFVVDCMGEGAMEIGAVGWCAAVRVRLLHATMRRRIQQRLAREWASKEPKPYLEERDGVPISQEDYAATLSVFASAPLVNLVKVGIRPTKQECEDYTALWKVIGYYMGIGEDVLDNHMSNWHQSSRLFACSIVSVMAGENDPPPPVHFPFDKALVPGQDRVKHTYPPNTNQDPWTSPATLPVLFSVCNRWPSPFDFVDHSAAARRLIGPTLSDWLSIPRTSAFAAFKLRLGFALANAPAHFAQWYRAGWDARRCRAMQNSVEGAMIAVLGGRETKFRPRADGAFEPRKEPDEYGVSPLGDAVRAVVDWTLLYAEMAGVLVVLSPALPLYFTWQVAKRLVGGPD